MPSLKLKIPKKRTNIGERQRQNYSTSHHTQETEPWTSVKVKIAKAKTSDSAKGYNVPKLTLA